LDTSMLMELSFASMRKLIRGNLKVKEVLLDYYRDRQRTTKEKDDKIG